jgi:hypothetical protein
MPLDNPKTLDEKLGALEPFEMKEKIAADQFRNDTRVFCAGCGTYFLPALVIADGTPKTETQFLCRTQTMCAIEDFYEKKGIKVLSRNRENKVRRQRKCTGILNDVLIKEMEESPALIANLLQYTPANLALNLLDGSNVRKGDPPALRRVGTGAIILTGTK